MSYWSSYENALNVGDRRVKALDDARDSYTQRQAGNALSGGNYADASNIFARSGDIANAQKMQQYGQQQQDVQRQDEERQRKQHAEVILRATDAIRRYSQMKPDANPLEAFDAVAPLLGQITDPQALAHIRQQFAQDPQSVLAMAESEAKKALQPVNLGNGGFGAFDPNQTDPNKSLTVLREPVRAPIALDTDKNYFMPDAPQTAGPSGFNGPAGAPRNQRNMNPGNIKDGPFARSQPGYTGSDGTFATFDGQQSGAGAQVALLRSYGQRGFNTVAKIINRWAPPSDNNPTPAYVQFVAGKLGVSPDQPLDLNNPQVAQAVAGAITQFEGGGQSASNGQQSAGIPGMHQIQQARPKKESAPSGYRYGASGDLEFIPGGPADPKNAKGAAAKPPTEYDKQTAAYAYRALAANDRLNAVIEGGHVKPTAWKLVSEKNGLTRLVVNNMDDRRFISASKEWLAPILRRDTGAAVTDSEFVYYADMFIPAPEDSPALLKQKAEARQDAMKALVDTAGQTYASTFPQRKFRSAWAAPSKGGQGAAQRGLSPEEAAKLPSGARFTGTDGVERVKH